MTANQRLARIGSGGVQRSADSQLLGGPAAALKEECK